MFGLMAFHAKAIHPGTGVLPASLDTRFHTVYFQDLLVLLMGRLA